MWNLVEADFLREYQIDLLQAVNNLSWRRFLALLSGLSPQSAFLNKLASQRQPTDVDGHPVKPTTARRLLSEPKAVARSIAMKRSG